MMHEVANRTASLSPPHTYVPWITVQGVHTEEEEAMADLVSLVCKLYQGPRPVQCSTASTSPNLFIEKSWRVEEEEKVVGKEEPVEIEEALEDLCSYLPSSVTKECDAFVTTYTALIISMLTKYLSLPMLSQNLGLCQGLHH